LAGSIVTGSLARSNTSNDSAILTGGLPGSKMDPRVVFGQLLIGDLPALVHDMRIEQLTIDPPRQGERDEQRFRRNCFFAQSG
jgi:hypothetical protein